MTTKLKMKLQTEELKSVNAGFGRVNPHTLQLNETQPITVRLSAQSEYRVGFRCSMFVKNYSPQIYNKLMLYLPCKAELIQLIILSVVKGSVSPGFMAA